MPKNLIATDQLTLTLSVGILAQLTQLTLTHAYGKNNADTAERILIAEVKRLLMSGEVDELKRRMTLTEQGGESKDERKET